MQMTTLLLAMRDSLLVVNRALDGWETDVRLAGKALRCIAASPHRPERVYGGTAREGLWRSDDLGRSWMQLGTAVLPSQVTAVAVSPFERGTSDEEVVYAGTGPSAIYRSTDGGETWKERAALLSLPSARTWSFPPRPETHHVRCIAPDPHVEGRLFVAIEAGALVSSADSGRSWTDRHPSGPYDTHTLVVHPRLPDRLYSAAGDGYFESDTGGSTWERREGGLEHRYAWGLAVDPNDAESVVISAAGSAADAHRADTAKSWIYRKTAGQPWRAITAGLPSPAGTTVSALVTDATDGVIYAANNRGIYRSVDTGASWERLALSWPERYRMQRVVGLAVAASEQDRGSVATE